MDTCEITVYGFHIDVFGHVNNARYLEFLEEARWKRFSEAARYLQKQGLAFVVANVNINYRSPAIMGQTLLVKTELVDFGKSSLNIAQEIHDKNTEALVADATVKAVVIDRKTSRPKLISDTIKQDLLSFL
ncbi:MAG: thioesterase [Waddliaceae bacterium]|nr:thioesterase [Waddliaceae bacterium]